MTIKGKLSGWHNVSSNSTLNIDGVSVQDILSILRSIQENDKFIQWKAALDYLYAHTVNRNNPHLLTVDQLATKVIQVVYEAWLLEGYAGTLEYFIDLLYRYLEYADDTIMNLEVSELHIPTVDVLAKYIVKHNTNPDAHDDKINSYFPGDSDILEPSLAFRQLVGMSEYETELINTNNTHYEKLSIQDDWMINEFTFIFSFDFESFKVFQLDSADGTTVFRVESKPNTNEIVFTRCINDEPLSIGIMDNLYEFFYSYGIDRVTIPNTNSRVKCFIKGKGSTISYGVYDTKVDTLFPLEENIVEFVLNDNPTEVAIPTIPRPPVNPMISFSRMELGDPLKDLLYYPKCLSSENLKFIFEHLDSTIYGTAAALNPNDPDIPHIVYPD